MLCRLAVNSDTLSEVMVTLSAMVGFEAVPLHSTYFPKLWLDVRSVAVSTCIGRWVRFYNCFFLFQHVDRKFISMLTSCSYFVDYIDAVLLDERMALTVDVIYEFLTVFFPKVCLQLISN